MDASTAQLGIWTIARFAAIAVLATEALFLWSRRSEPAGAPEAPASSRFFWALTPALILAGVALWCFTSVAAQGAGPIVAQLSR